MFWKGRAAKWTRPAACGGARDMELVRTPPEGRSVYGRCNGNTHNGTNCFSARQRYFVLQRPFLPYLFPQEGKDMVAEGTVRCHRKRGTPVNPKKATPAAQLGGQHPQGVCRIRSAPAPLTAARGRPPLHKVGNAPTSIRQIFNGRK